MKKEKRLLMDKESFIYVIKRRGWDYRFSEEAITPKDIIETVTLYTGFGADRKSLERALTTETEEAVDYQLRNMIREFDEYLVEKELKNYREYIKLLNS